MLTANTASHFLPKKILLPVDFSPSSYVALGVGTDLAQHFGAELILLTVVPMFSADKISDEFISTFSPDSVRIDDLEQLARITTELVSRGIKARSKTEVGEDVVGNIMLTIDKEHIDLLIISTHGCSGWREAFLGSIAESVVKQIECPLLLLRSVKPGVRVNQKEKQMAGAILGGSGRH
jgi:nucleotide-binding universal stress UspA family protein